MAPSLVLVLVTLSAARGFVVPSAPSTAAVGRAAVQMNTQYTNLKTIGFKKDKKTGDSLALKGYTVGSRAPKASRSSGTKEQFGYGIGNLYGGKMADGSQKSKGGDIKGKIEADATGAIGRIGTAWLGLVTLFLLTKIGGQ